MATVTAESPASPTIAARRGTRAPRSLGRMVERWALPTFTVLAMAYLLIPIVVMILFSFNDYLPYGKFNFIWHGFTLDAWRAPLAWPGLPDAIRNSLLVATTSTVIATILGTLIGLSLSRYSFRGRGAINGLIFLPM